MYRRVYRQEGGGLSDLGSEAFMRQYIDNYVQDYNRRNQGEIAQRVGARPVPKFNNRYLPTPRQPIPIPQQVQPIPIPQQVLDVPQQVQPIPIPQQVLDVPQQVLDVPQQVLDVPQQLINQSVATPISMQNEQQATGFQKVNNEVLKPVQEQQQGLPRLMEIVNEQLNPTPVDPNAPYGYVEYTPPFYGGMAIPPGGNKPYMVPADKDGNPVNPKGIFKATL